MPMSALNNTMTMMGLGELNKNITKVGKELAKISSGQRIAGASDGPSDYAISEKMRTRIRGLNQCDQNTQTGKNMIEVAAGAVGNQLEALKKLREIALKSSDDTYTDFDRDILQKEAKQLLQEIDDIAYETNYNGKLLLNGITATEGTSYVDGVPYDVFDPLGSAHNNTSPIIAYDANDPDFANSTKLKSKSTSKVQLKSDSKSFMPIEPTKYGYLPSTLYDPTQIIRTPMSSLSGLKLNQAVVDAMGNSYNTSYVAYSNNYDYMLTAEDNNGNIYLLVDQNGDGTDMNTQAPVSASNFPAGYPTLVAHSQEYAQLPATSWTTGTTVATSNGVGSSTYTMYQDEITGKWIGDGYGSVSSYKLDFPKLQGANFPSVLQNQGFSILCGACSQFISIRFDTSAPSGTAQFWRGNPNDSNYSDTIAYSVGVSDVTSPEELAKAIYDGINSIKNPVGQAPWKHDISIVKSETSDNYFIKKNDSAGNQSLIVYDGFKGDISTIMPETISTKGTKKPYQDFRIQGETKASMYTNLRFNNTTLKVLFPPADSDFDIDPAEEDYPNPWPNEYLYMSDIDKEYYNEKYECDGDEEKIRREKWRDEFWPYPRKGAVPTESAVRSKDSAKKFIGDIDNAIKYILDTATTFGSQSMRMTIMNDNIVSANENTQSSESVIRDADMAKEMVNYTKNNVIMQSSQAMLSQANQNVSQVLSLLQ